MALPPPSGDPRLGDRVVGDVRPLVRTPRRGVSTTAISVGAVIAAMLLFGALEARRQSLRAPAVTARLDDVSGSNAPPPLAIPPEPAAITDQPLVRLAVPPVTPPRPTPPVQPSPLPQVVYVPSPQPVPQTYLQPPRVSGGQALVLDTGAGGPSSARPGEGPGDASSQSGATAAPRARASVMANRSTTVPQGTLIAAVLETAFDSTQPGFARALVQNDVRGFDGTKILIPRGSRLIGEYGTVPAAGQNRAKIAWSRLIRPDGVSIAVGSPAADPLGRGGLRAKVNTHFVERFAGAILQSALDVGVNLAARSASTPVIVALPGSVNTTTSQLIKQTDIPPTLKVRQGTSVSVFVARDLDFTDAEPEQ